MGWSQGQGIPIRIHRNPTIGQIKAMARGSKVSRAVFKHDDETGEVHAGDHDKFGHYDLPAARGIEGYVYKLPMPLPLGSEPAGRGSGNPPRRYEARSGFKYAYAADGPRNHPFLKKLRASGVRSSGSREFAIIAQWTNNRAKEIDEEPDTENPDERTWYEPARKLHDERQAKKGASESSGIAAPKAPALPGVGKPKDA